MEPDRCIKYSGHVLLLNLEEQVVMILKDLTLFLL